MSKHSAIMDNFNVQITSYAKWHFEYVLDMAIEQNISVTHYVVDKDNSRMTLFWHEPGKVYEDDKTLDVVALPYKMNTKSMTEFVWGWLKQANCEEQEPDIDGSVRKGFKIYNDFWGRALDNSYGVVSIETAWALIGK